MTNPLNQQERDELRRLCEAGDEHPDIEAGLMASGSKMAAEYRKHVHLEAWLALPKLLHALDEAEEDFHVMAALHYRSDLTESERHEKCREVANAAFGEPEP